MIIMELSCNKPELKSVSFNFNKRKNNHFHVLKETGI